MSEMLKSWGTELLTALLFAFLFFLLVAKNRPGAAAVEPIKPIQVAPRPEDQESKTVSQEESLATFGMGCFWCGEAIFEQLDGVKKVESGFMGGDRPHPTYEQVLSGKTGYVEVIHITFDPQVISYLELLEFFWKGHDPTTLDRQGNDIGPQYRSVIFYHNEDQKALALSSKEQLEREKIFKEAIITEIIKESPFYKASDKHQDYYKRNKSAPYCRFVIAPKLKKLKLKP